jgi:hypothetical protein
MKTSVQTPRRGISTAAPSFTGSGRFFVGCNYWASHAGTRMWADWRESVVREDLKQLADAGMQVLRVFPIWPDFQPIHQLYGGSGRKREIRHGEKPLGHDEIGRAGMSRTALNHFKKLADLAQQNNQKLVVGLITGWMSGRLFVPPALEGLNVLTDPAALRWQARFIKIFVGMFKDHPAITAWDLGNECNCMAPVETADQAWLWTSHIVNAIRAIDPVRPVVSGMHSLVPAGKYQWKIQDQAELTDVLTTHPYPPFVPHCDQDPVNTMRNGLQATAESLFYAGIGNKPCFAEELGTLGPMVASEQVAAEYVRSALFSLWAHDCRGLLWWCAYDQDQLTHPPYDWGPVERELGMFHADRSPKPLVAIMKKFGTLLNKIPLTELPARTIQGVCVLAENQDQWGAAYASFVLAKQANLDITFQQAGQPLRDSNLYLLPSVAGMSPFMHHVWQELLTRVEKGATLYLSHDDCYLSPFAEVFGLEVITRERRLAPATVTLDGLEGKPGFILPSKVKLTLKPGRRTKVLGSEKDGNPAFACAAYGKGKVYFLSVPIEKYLSETPGSFHSPAAQPFWKIYRHIAAPFIKDRAAACLHPSLGSTEHPLPDGNRVLVLVNYGPVPVQAPLKLAPGWSVAATWYGQKVSSGTCLVDRNDAVVLLLQR